MMLSEAFSPIGEESANGWLGIATSFLFFLVPSFLLLACMCHIMGLRSLIVPIFILLRGGR